MAMTDRDSSPSSDQEARVLKFRRPERPERAPANGRSPVADLAKYERAPGGTDDYRHRMVVNLVALVFVVALIGAGLWLADTMVRMRHDQDCYLSGRRGCSPVEVSKDRW
ncbi:MAG TPA: hypothetical protein VI251_19810 [Pseudolabrys sp.]|jgi:hypothetical protein